jgi:putative acetyltransferase
MITFQRSDNSNPDFKKFCEELDKEFRVRYPDSQQNFQPNNTVNEFARIIVVYDDKTPIGCGCYRPAREFNAVEIKRMYVRPERRGVGIARMILSELEIWAGEEGYEAMALYSRSGYRLIPNYPPYVDVSESICMKKEFT